MPKLIITSGPPATGKTTWVRKWLKRASWRTTAPTLEEAFRHMARGYDVVIDTEGNDFGIEVKTFAEQVPGAEPVPEPVEPQFFFTTHHPHQWTSGGPGVRTFNDQYQPIASLAEARELAIKHYVGGHNESHTDTTYGTLARITGDEK